MGVGVVFGPLLLLMVVGASEFAGKHARQQQKGRVDATFRKKIKKGKAVTKEDVVGLPKPQEEDRP